MLAGLILAIALGASTSAIQVLPAPSERVADMQPLCKQFPSIVQLDGDSLGCIADNEDATIEAFRALTQHHVRYIYVARLKTPDDESGSPTLLIIEPGDAAEPTSNE